MNFDQILALTWRNRRTIIVVAVVAALLAAIFSAPWFIRPMYRSLAAVYPVNLHSYSGETPTEQLLQLLGSNQVRDTLVKRFRLDSAYKLDLTQRGGQYALNKEYSARVTFNKTVYESVELQVLDEDPIRARDMVRVVLGEVNDLALALHRKRASEVLVIATDALEQEQTKLDRIASRLDSLRQGSGLLAYDQQVRELTRGIMQMLTTGAPRQRLDEVRTMLRQMEEHGGEFRDLTELSEMRLASYSALLDQYEKARSDVAKVLTYLDVVVHPEVNDKKVYPVRWLILVLSVVSAVFITILFLVIRDHRR